MTPLFPFASFCEETELVRLPGDVTAAGAAAQPSGLMTHHVALVDQLQPS